MRIALAAAACLLPVFVSSPALAQAPGAAPPAAPEAGVATSAPATAPRWTVGLRLTGASLGRADADAPELETGGGGAFARYRVSRRWEAELTLDAGAEQAETGGALPGGRELHSATAAALFRIAPERRWTGYLLGGVGSTHVSDAAGTTLLEAGHLALGAGVERRFGRVVLTADLRTTVLAEPTDDDAAPTMARAGEPAPAPMASSEREPLIGATFSLAGAYRF